MSRALVTYGDGPHAELLEIALPSFHAFAELHDYELLIPGWEPTTSPLRPQSWWKVPALLSAFDAGYDEALWLDADTVIVDPTDDLEAPADAWQAMTRHTTADGDVPNCGVWLVREPMRLFLERAWAMTHHINAPWWEQTAICELLGYDITVRPITLLAESPLYKHTHWLDPGWNRHVRDQQPTDHVRIQHATMLEDRATAMREWAATC